MGFKNIVKDSLHSLHRLFHSKYSRTLQTHYNDVIMTTMASVITSPTVVYSTVYSDADKRNIKAPRHWPLCGEFTGTGEFPAQRASYAENVSIWWRHHEIHTPAITQYREFISVTPALNIWAQKLIRNQCKFFKINRCFTVYVIIRTSNVRCLLRIGLVSKLVHNSVLNCALWDMEQVHCGICEICLSAGVTSYVTG